MFRDFYASKRLTQVSNNNTISVPSLTHRTHATRRENHPPFESPRFNQREKANEGSHLHSPRANTTPPLFLQTTDDGDAKQQQQPDVVAVECTGGCAKRGESEERVEVRERGFVQRESAAVLLSPIDAERIAAVFSLERNRRAETEERGATGKSSEYVFVATTTSTTTKKERRISSSARDETNVTSGIYEWNRDGVDGGEESGGCRDADR